MPLSDVDVVALEVTRLLASMGIRHLVGGSVASSVHGVPRFTRDVDIVAEIRGEHAHALAAAVEDAYYVDEMMIASAVRRGASFNLAHLATMVKVDLFVATQDPFTLSELDRRIRVRIGDPGDELFVATAEDVILQKLRWYKKGGGVAEQQIRDVVGVLQVSGPSLDEDHLERWASRLGVEELLRRAREAARPA